MSLFNRKSKTAKGYNNSQVIQDATGEITIKFADGVTLSLTDLYKVSALYSVISVIANNIGQVPYYFTNRLGEPLKEVPRDVSIFMDKPNMYQYWENWLETGSIHYDLFGDAINHVSKENVSSQWLPKNQIYIKQARDGHLMYEYYGTSIHKNYTELDIVRINKPDPFNIIQGFSPAKALEGALSIIYYFNRNMKNKHRATGFWTV